VLSFRIPEENPENCNSLKGYSGRLKKSHNINAISPVKTQRVAHSFSTVKQDFVTLKMKAIQPFEERRTASHPTITEKSATPLTAPEITQQ
jgi:hypothetical protein